MLELSLNQNGLLDYVLKKKIKITESMINFNSFNLGLEFKLGSIYLIKDYCEEDVFESIYLLKK